jgi:hypothetical protein
MIAGRPSTAAPPASSTTNAESTPGIARQRPAARGGTTDASGSFDSLRARGLKLVESLSGKTWTDYNLHDPGVTILEQLCYALTDLIYRADFAVADHLQADADTGIEFEALSLHPPHQALPCRATSASDYRRVLLDQVEGLDDVDFRVGPHDAQADVSLGDQRGLYRLQLSLSQGQAAGSDDRLSLARAAYRQQRNLCEDIEHGVTLVKPAWCQLQLDIELSGPRDAADVLADIYSRCGRHLARVPGFHSLGELLAQGQSVEQIYTGPITEHGFMTEVDAPLRELLFVGDLGSLIQDIAGVERIGRLALVREGQAPSVGAMSWRGDGWVLRLRIPGCQAHDSATEPSDQTLLDQVWLRRRGNRVIVPAEDLASRLADLGAGNLARRQGHRSTERLAMPQGRYRDLTRYHSIQNDFPATYGLGFKGLPASAPAQRKAQVVQLQTYLALFEQVLANSAAQIHHLRDLFTADQPLGPSYWWQLLGNQQIPGLDEAYCLSGAPSLPPAELRARVLARVFESTDPRADRRSRVLDHLLALHGVTYTQNSMRQFSSYLNAAELESALLENKASFLRDIVTLNRDRGAGIDYGRPSWNRHDNVSGLQRRLSFLLGFRHSHSRSLTLTFRKQRRRLVNSAAQRAALHQSHGALSAPADSVALPQQPPGQRLRSAEIHADLSRIGPLRGKLISATFLRCAVFADRYRVCSAPAPLAGSAPTPAQRLQLWLGPDDDGRWWSLAEFDTVAQAARAAASLRHFLLHLNHDSEGLHVVEHVLLRPIGASPDHAALVDLPSDFFALRLTVVLPSWPVRCAQDAFQHFVAETVEINCPAHVAANGLWLDVDAMRRFEVRYRLWLRCRIRFCKQVGNLLDEASADANAIARLNRAACGVIDCLREVWSTNPGPLLTDEYRR